MAKPTEKLHPVLIRRPKVLQRCAISNTTLHRLITAGEFPPPVQLGERSVAWVESEVDAWIEARIEASRTQRGAGHV